MSLKDLKSKVNQQILTRFFPLRRDRGMNRIDRVNGHRNYTKNITKSVIIAALIIPFRMQYHFVKVIAATRIHCLVIRHY